MIRRFRVGLAWHGKLWSHEKYVEHWHTIMSAEPSPMDGPHATISDETHNTLMAMCFLVFRWWHIGQRVIPLKREGEKWVPVNDL